MSRYHGAAIGGNAIKGATRTGNLKWRCTAYQRRPSSLCIRVCRLFGWGVRFAATWIRRIGGEKRCDGDAGFATNFGLREPSIGN